MIHIKYLGQIDDGVLLDVYNDGNVSRHILTPEESLLKIDNLEMSDAEKDYEWNEHLKTKDND